MENVTIGGERLGSGNKMKAAMHNYERSTHDLSRVWRSSMACGVLTPSFVELMENGDDFSINIDTLIRTLPTQGPLMASFKFQTDLFFCPLRLYQGLTHSNTVNIGLKMNQVLLPQIELKQIPHNMLLSLFRGGQNIDTYAINQSSILAYLGIRNVGQTMNATEQHPTIAKMCVPLLAYWDIFKNYYSNKQEEDAYVITPSLQKTWPYRVQIPVQNPENPIAVFYNQNTEKDTKIQTNWNIPPAYGKGKYYIVSVRKDADPTKLLNEDGRPINVYLWFRDPNNNSLTELDWEEAMEPGTDFGNTSWLGSTSAWIKASEAAELNPTSLYGQMKDTVYKKYADQNGQVTIEYIEFLEGTETETFKENALTPFPLENLEEARREILANNNLEERVIIKDNRATKEKGVINYLPYNAAINSKDESSVTMFAKEPLAGLAVKCYQSDIFNNWLNEELVTGENGINELSKVSTADGLTMDALNYAQKVYNMLNRIVLKGNTYEDWQEAVFAEDALRRAESPIYIGGLSSEIVFDEVVSTASTETEAAGESPLGTLGGRGNQQNKKGGYIEYKAKELGFIIAISSITPRIDYSQGNKWWTDLNSINDVHKPALDGIGFQDLITENMSGIELVIDQSGNKIRKSAGKIPAWLFYMTAVNECFGEFADKDKLMYLTLNRRYEYEEQADLIQIKDLTTYIDPAKHNYAFVDASLTSQNFWVQIGFDVKARRKMSAKIIPNL